MNAEPPVHFDLRSMLTLGHLTSAVLRVAVALFVLAVGFAGLAYLHDAERGGLGRLQVSDATKPYVLGVTLRSIQLLATSILLLECTLPLVASAGLRWWATLWILPCAWAVLGGLVVWRVFSLDELEDASKSLTIVVGSGVVFFLASSLHVALWQATAAPEADAKDFPFLWYLTLAMMGAAFFGAHRGWTGLGPQLKQVIRYCDREWPRARLPTEGVPAVDQTIQ